MQTLHGKGYTDKWLINIRGCNGSGKSTIPMSMVDDPEMYVVKRPYKGRDRNVFTVFPTYGWVVLGSYFNKCGGLDGFVDTAMILKATWYALKKFPDYNIIMEGVIPSTVFSTYANLFQEIQEKYPERKVIVVNLLPPVEECLKRIQKRNGGKAIKSDLVKNKWTTVAKNADKFTEAGILSLKWDNSEIGGKFGRINMVDALVKFIRKEAKECGQLL